MADIILTIAGPWGKPPPFDTAFALEPGPADPTLVEDFRFLARETEGVDAAQLKALSRHASVCVARRTFDAPGSLAAARDAARLIRSAFAGGALGVRVETGLKVFAPGITEGLDLNDPKVLLHLFVEVLIDDEVVATEGMQSFDLAEVRVPFGADDVEPAQAAAFALSARMVCDGFKPIDGGVFRASESAPLYAVRFAAPTGEPDDPFENSRGAWVLARAS